MDSCSGGNCLSANTTLSIGIRVSNPLLPMDYFHQTLPLSLFSCCRLCFCSSCSKFAFRFSACCACRASCIYLLTSLFFIFLLAACESINRLLLVDSSGGVRSGGTASRPISHIMAYNFLEQSILLLVVGPLWADVITISSELAE